MHPQVVQCVRCSKHVGQYVKKDVRACWHSFCGVVCLLHSIFWQFRPLHLFSAPLNAWVCRYRGQTEGSQLLWQISHKWASAACICISVISTFFTDINGLRSVLDPGKGTLRGGPLRCGLVPAGGGPLLLPP